MKKPALLLLAGLLLSCESGNYKLGLTGADTQYLPETSPETPDSGTGNWFYFSYDDSASTAGPELAKYRLDHGLLPDASLGRPWEFLNLESARFRTEALEAVPEDGIFSLSMGLRADGGAEDGTTEYHFGALVKSPERTAADRDNVVLTLIVDVSGSMGEPVTQVEETALTKMELVKLALKAMVASLKPGDVVNLVTFSTSASTVLQGAVFEGGESFPQYAQCVDALRPTDSTDLDKGIAEGYRTAWATFVAGRSNRVVILTDAWANTGVVDSTQIAAGISRDDAEGILFSGVGVGADFQEAFLNELTEKGKGSYFALVTRGDAQRVMRDRFIALIAAAARQVRFRLDFPASLAHVTTASEESSTEAEDVQPTSFSYNTAQYFFEGFRTTAAGTEPAGGEAFTLTIRYTDPRTSTEATRSVTKTVAELLAAGGADMPEGANIRDARVVFLLAELIGGRITGEDAGAVLESDYADSSANATEIFLEYSAWIESYRAMAR